MAKTTNTSDETNSGKNVNTAKKTGTSGNANSTKKTASSGNVNTSKKAGASGSTNTSKKTGATGNTNTSKKKYSSGKTNSSRDINISKKTNSSKKTKNLKKMKKSKKSKDYLLWLVPLIMMIFLALEAGGLYYMTTHYGSSSGNQVAGNEEEETTTTDTTETETTLAALRQEEETDDVEDESKRTWDGEFGGIDMGDNTFTINWTSEFATSYEVQCYDTASLSWETVNILDPAEEDVGTTATAGESAIAADGTCTYMTPRLEPCREYRYRVVAYDADTWAVSATLICETQECALDATVWPVKDLTGYTTSSGYNIAGTVETLKAYLVVDEADGRFGVKVGDETWYIDSDYCMINLPDYIGDLCEYDITNSYSSMYTINNYSIPTVTNMVITGYENVSLEGEEYLVPLLYPAAKKLVIAANDAKSQGYHLKIYDSYRPNDATSFLYSTVSSILNDKVPETEYQQTYRQVMIGNSSYSLNNFLAKGRSMHNLGIAMDLTLVDDSTGKELTMQTLMHDLSHYAATSENTESADLLRDIMVNAGFGTLVSEWWHFQDNEARDSLNLPTLSGGVSPLEED